MSGDQNGQRYSVAEHACWVGFLANDPALGVQGLYLLDRATGRISLHRQGDLRTIMAGVCLDQAWMRHAVLHVLFFVDLPGLEQVLGARGYRYAMQAAGRLGQRLYLAAETMGVGACGVGAFYDGEAAKVLALPTGVALAYALALGPVKAGG